MKVPLSRSAGGGQLLLWRLLSILALAAVLVLPSTAFASMAFATEPPPGPGNLPTATAATPTLKVVVIGDSFTSGEGANPSTYSTVLAPGNTTKSGQQTYSYQIDPAHQSSTAPTLQALNQIQAANPGVQLNVTFVPVSGATRDSLYQTTQPGTAFVHPPQIDAVNGADVVIVGIGGNDARFTDWITTVLSSKESTSTQAFPQFMQPFNDGSYLTNQVNLLNDISSRATPSATIISLGYPKAMPAQIPGTPTWWSPFSWSTISQGEANMSNQLAGALNTANQDASFAASASHKSQQFLFADVSDALQGHELFTNQEGLNGLTPSNKQGSYHPNDLGQQLLGSVLQPYLEQGVNDQLIRQGVQGAQNVAPITPTFAYQWNLRVQLPLQMQQLNQQQQQSDQLTPEKFKELTFQPTPLKEWPAPPAGPNTAKPDQAKPDQANPDQVQPPNGQPDNNPAAGSNQPDANPATGTGQPAAQPDANPPAGTAQPDSNQAAGTAQPAAQPNANPAASSNQPAAQPDANPAAGADQPAAQPGASPAGTNQPAAQPDANPAAGTGQPAAQPDANPAASADQPGASPAGTGQPAAQPDSNPAAGTGQPTAQPDANPATGGQPAGTGQPAAPPADTPANPAPAGTPAAPAPADTPASPAPAEPPAVQAVPPAAPAPVEPPAAPAPVVAPEVPTPVAVPEAPPAPVIQPIAPPVIEPIAPPPPVIAPVPVPAPEPITSPDLSSSGSSLDSGSGSLSGLDSGSSLDSGASSADSGGGGGE